jgi:uncharacterized protein DUF6600/FecR-like protein
MSMANVGKRLLVWAVLTGAVLVTGASAESKARIVRLSEVQGDVQMDRDTGGGFEKAFLNLPVIEGAKLKTGDAGRAEVEFEDGSVLRIVPNSELDFTRLALGDDGQKLSTVELIQGTVYANVSPKKGDGFTLNFGRESVTLTTSAHFRTSLTKDDATLAVFQGDVQVTGPSGQVEVGKKHSATFDLANNDSYTLAKNYDEDPNDKWDQKQNEYRTRYSSNGASSISSPYAYGMSDLNYYGNYFDAPGYGMVWQPYFAGMGWSPFQDGGWAWYPGFGYMWVSAYPWGWMPYRYGNWVFVPSFGWVWQPGFWNTWFAIPRVVNPPIRTAVPTPPVRSRATVMVGRGLTVNPVAEPPRRLTIAAGSAGLGVPRGAVRHLDRFAKEAVKSPGPVVVTTARPPMSSGVGPTASRTGSAISAPRASPPTRSSSPPARSSKPH